MSQNARGFVDSRDLVLVAIPCFNEEDHIANVVETLLAGADDIRMRIVVADGGSTDRTRAIVNSSPRAMIAFCSWTTRGRSRAPR
jgi:succinoglycan biosynthesis protein ExoA